ncbi:MAG TPA: tetratricopeptide repeat protein, partial [Bacteroidales bacterium]|nr:tetratricopeptide repeat protein [Bacteroidales bacterium]
MRKSLMIVFVLLLGLSSLNSLNAQRYAEDYIKSGTLSAKVGDLDQAMADFTKAIELDARVPEGFYNRGLIYLKRKEFDLAAADFAKARKLRPERADILLQSGITAKNLGKDQEAISFIRKAIRVDSKSPEARFNLGLIFFE